MNLQKIIESLNQSQRAQLMTAFNHHFTQRVVFPDNTFIGVNIVPGPDILITEQTGCWSIGKILRRKPCQ
jgi:hypothetical protein